MIAISVCRSRIDIAAVFAATSAIVIATIKPTTLAIANTTRKFESAFEKNANSVSVRVSAPEFANIKSISSATLGIASDASTLTQYMLTGARRLVASSR